MLFLPSLGIVSESSWKENGPIVFLLRGGGQSDSSPSQTEEMPIVLDSPSSTNFFAISIRLPFVNLLPGERCCLPLFVSAVPPLPSSASLL